MANLNIPVGTAKCSKTPEQRLQWHREQEQHYSEMLSSSKTKGLMGAAYNGIVRHRAAITALEIELGLFQSRQIIRA